MEKTKRKTMRKTGMGITFALALLVSAYAVVQYVVFSPKSAGLVQLHLLDADFPYRQWVNFMYLHAVGSAVGVGRRAALVQHAASGETSVAASPAGQAVYRVDRGRRSFRHLLVL